MAGKDFDIPCSKESIEVIMGKFRTLLRVMYFESQMVGGHHDLCKA